MMLATKLGAARIAARMRGTKYASARTRVVISSQAALLSVCGACVVGDGVLDVGSNLSRHDEVPAFV